MKWNKLSRDDYKSECGRFKIVRMDACDNKYNNRDEWILAVRQNDQWEAVDVFPLLRDAKNAANTVQIV